MSGGSTPEGPRAAAQELAARIYVELVAGSMRAEGNPAKVVAGATSMASLSMQLAEIFLQAEDKAAAKRAPDLPFELDASNIAQWSSGAAPREK